MKIEAGSVWRWKHKPSIHIKVLEIWRDNHYTKMVDYRDNYTNTLSVVSISFFEEHFEPVPEKDWEAECSVLQSELAHKDQQIAVLKEKLAEYKEALSVVRNVNQRLVVGVDEMLFCMENE